MERRPGLFWLAALVLLGLALYLLGGVLLPFVAGCAIAYFLNPVVDRLEAWHVPRGLGAAAVLMGFMLVIVLLVLLLLPLVELEVAELVQRLPAAVEFARSETQALLAMAQEKLAPEDLAKLRDMAGGWAASAAAWLGRLAGGLLSGGRALVGLLSLVIVTPVVAFFLLRDWQRLVAEIDSWLPRRHADTIREQLRLIDETLAGFVHGQMLVALVLAAYYGLGLTLVGLPFAVIVGITVGVLSFIPFVGVGIGLVLAIALGLSQFGPGTRLAVVLGIFVVGHAVENNFLTPRLVGRRINLHPVWVIFALLAFGSVFGFVGVLLAVPAAAVIGVLARFAVARYLASSLYDPGNLPRDGG